MDNPEQLHFGRDYDSLFDHEFYAEKALSDTLFREGQTFCYEWLIGILCKGDICGQRILELGTGPTIFNAAYVAPFFNEIYLSDIAERNRNYISSWWRGEKSDKIEAMIKEVVSNEGKGVNMEEREKEVQRKINAILPCDVLLPNPLHPCLLRQVDAVIMRFVLDAAVKDEKEYSLALENIATLLPKGGYLIGMCVAARHYSVKDVKFRSCGIDHTRMRSIWEDSDFSILSWKDGGVVKKDTGRHVPMFNVLAVKK